MNKIALFIDRDNISTIEIPNIIKDLENRGNIIIKRAYADFVKHPTLNTCCVDNGLVPVHQCTSISGKNSTDMILVIDIMKILYEKQDIDIFVIASFDSDYIAVIQLLKEYEKKVIVYGYEGTTSFSQ